jgi:hypothetical protein
MVCREGTYWRVLLRWAVTASRLAMAFLPTMDTTTMRYLPLNWPLAMACTLSKYISGGNSLFITSSSAVTEKVLKTPSCIGPIQGCAIVVLKRSLSSGLGRPKTCDQVLVDGIPWIHEIRLDRSELPIEKDRRPLLAADRTPDLSQISWKIFCPWHFGMSQLAQPYPRKWPKSAERFRQQHDL